MNTTTRIALLLAAASVLPLRAHAGAQTRALNEAGAVASAANRPGEPQGQPGGLFISGVVDQFRIDPHGRISGVILRDGTEIVVGTSAAAALPNMLRGGDRIRTPYGPNNTLEIEDARTGRFVEIGTVDQVARGGGPMSVGPVQPYARVDDASVLPRLATTGRVRMMLHQPNGAPAGFIMDNGTQVHVVPSAAGAVAEQLSPGETIRVEGRGTRTPMATGLWAVTITRPNNLVLLDMKRGIGSPERNLR